MDRTSGRRRGSQHLLQIDHVVPYARGGAAECLEHWPYAEFLPIVEALDG